MKKITQTPNLTELTYRSIKQTVLLGGVEKSFRLTEEFLARELGISKSPVREALNRLEAEGLIQIEPRKGAYVRQFSASEVQDLYDLRVVLELHCIDAAKITPTLLEALGDSVSRARSILDEGDQHRHIEEDLRFHMMLAEATGNLELCRVFDNLQQKTLLCRYRSYGLSASRSPEAHRQIYEALRLDDREAARNAMRDHILFVRDRILAGTPDA
jgi:DNA-binding GntR family transcriptional regulator